MARLQDIGWASRVFDRNGVKRIGHNTKLHWLFGGWALQYHSTTVVSFRETDYGVELTVNTGGWFSVTTLQRIRHGLAAVNLQLVVELGGKWRVMDHKGNAWTIRGNKLMLRHDGNEWSRVAE